MNRKKLVRGVLWAAGGLAVLLLAAALVLPPLLDAPRISAELQKKVSAMAGAEVRWDDLDLQLLPRPRSVLRVLSVKAEGVQAQAARVEVGLRLLPLLRGQAEITSMSIQRPVVNVDLDAGRPAAPPPAGEQPAKTPADLYRDLIEALVFYLPQSSIAVDQGELHVRRKGMPPLDLTGLTLHATSDERGMKLDVSAASRNWNHLELAARFGYADFSTDATLDAAEVKPQQWLDWSLQASPLRLGLPNAAVKAHLRGAEGKPVELDVALDAGNVELANRERRVTIPGVRMIAQLRSQGGESTVRADELRLGASRLTGAELRYHHAKGTLASDLAFDLDLPQLREYALELAPPQAQEILARLPPLGGRAKGRLTLASALASPARGWDAGLSIAVLDGNVSAAAKLTDLERGPKVRGSLAESTLGPELLAWIWKAAELPPSVALKAPVRVSMPRLGWAPKAPLELQASAAFEAGQTVSADLSWSAGVLNLRRAGITDKLSNATLSLRSKGGVYDGRYAGKLDSRSLAGILSGASSLSGALTGDLRFTYDQAQPRRTSATGSLKGEKIDLSWLAGKPADIERVALSSDGETLRVAEATLEWAGQRATLSGQGKRTADGLAVDLSIDSPGILVDALLPENKGQATGETKGIWPLPVTGRVAIRSDFIQYKHHKVAPVAATLVLERERAQAQMTEGALCGISLPFTLEATPQGYSAAAKISAARQPMETAGTCLTNEKMMLTGALDLQADLRTQGKLSELVQNLEGTVNTSVRDGRMEKFALVGNILSMQNVVDVMKGGPKLDQQGFPFRRLSATGRFEKGRLVIDEGMFQSDAIGLAAQGSISLTDFDSRLTVLVAPLGLADEAVRKLPVLGYVLGGALTSLPVSVSGDIRDPRVVALGPGAITNELLGIVKRTVTLPKKLVEPLRDGK